MEKYCSFCGRVFNDSDFIICPYCGNQLNSRVGRQPIPRKLRHQVFQRDGYRCVECGATNKQTRLHVNHIKPVAKGGTNELSNLQTLCEACNLAKYTDEWVGGKINKSNNNDNESSNSKTNEKKASFRIKKQEIRVKKNDSIKVKMNKTLKKFSEDCSVRDTSKLLKIPVGDIQDWYWNGKKSIDKYVEFYDQINKYFPNIVYEIEDPYQRMEKYKRSLRNDENKPEISYYDHLTKQYEYLKSEHQKLENILLNSTNEHVKTDYMGKIYQVDEYMHEIETILNELDDEKRKRELISGDSLP